MKHIYSCSVLLGLSLLAACTTVSGNSISLRTGYRVSTGAVSPQTKIFLVAGSLDSANFAQEVIDQIKFWTEQGYSREEIACYYIPPMGEESKDVEQFSALFSELRDCYFADPRAIFENIRSVAKSNPNEVYVYVSSHGSKPLAEKTFKYKDAKVQSRVEEIQKLPTWGTPYTLEVEGHKESDMQFWAYSNLDKAYVFASTYKDSGETLMFTPAGLRGALGALPELTKKYIVLQGCFTGGFVLPEKTVGVGKTLVGLKNIKALTASQHNKTSYGCDEGSHTTYFGEAYMNSLRKHAVGKKLNEINWDQIYKSTLTEVKEKEIALSGAKTSFSNPQYYFDAI